MEPELEHLSAVSTLVQPPSGSLALGFSGVLSTWLCLFQHRVFFLQERSVGRLGENLLLASGSIWRGLFSAQEGCRDAVFS